MSGKRITVREATSVFLVFGLLWIAGWIAMLAIVGGLLLLNGTS